MSRWRCRPVRRGVLVVELTGDASLDALTRFVTVTANRLRLGEACARGCWVARQECAGAILHEGEKLASR